MRSNVVEINNYVAIIFDGLFIHLLRLEGKALIWAYVYSKEKTGIDEYI